MGRWAGIGDCWKPGWDECEAGLPDCVVAKVGIAGHWFSPTWLGGPWKRCLCII